MRRDKDPHGNEEIVLSDADIFRLLFALGYAHGRLGGLNALSDAPVAEDLQKLLDIVTAIGMNAVTVRRTREGEQA